MKYTAILVINWNGGADTIRCLESLLPTLTPTEFLFLIDNGSTDTSVTDIKSFFTAKGLTLRSTHRENFVQNFDLQQKWYLVTNSENLGFGAGNNVVLKYLKDLDKNFEFAWLLNNDAVPEQKALALLKQKLSQDPTIGAAGSLLLNYPDNGLIQCTGVKHYKFFGVSKLINKNKPYKELDRKHEINFDYLNGASLLLNLGALEKTGYFDERFFLYSEELDLELRLQQNNYRLVLDLDSTVYHKLGGGTNRKKYLFYYYYNTSAVLLSRKHYGVFYTTCAIVNLLAITCIRTFPSFKSFKWGIKGILTGLK
ncbi:hypothetical protein CNR22_19335 [Sphingobacteriaceae bacterium]|nr:hypothetical protein CNR22_19335 [Sphingobacteriaceae bacterium]